MADSEITTPAPEEGDAELLRLGVEHKAMLRQYEARDYGDETPASDRFLEALVTLENRIAAIPATTVAGMGVRLWVLWSWHCTEPGVLFKDPTAEASSEEQLVWGLIQDAERVAARA